nr:hypothetical protein [Tanacetum cinerariifolium]
MIKLMMHTVKNDMVIHIEKTGMMGLVVEIDIVGMIADVVDKVTCLFDGLQLKQVDLKCVYTLNEPHLHDIRVVPNRHEVDQHLSCADPLLTLHPSQIYSTLEEECSKTSCASSRKYTTSVTKTKAPDYGHIKWIEDLVPRTMWIQEPIGYDKHGRKRQQFYGFAVNRESTRIVYSKRRIIVVTELKIVKWHNYKHLDWITVRRDDDKLYKFKEDAPEQKVTPPPHITTITSLSAKFPYLKKGEYDIWAMKMQNYISSTDLQCWNIVQKGNSQKNITSDTEGNIIIAPPVTVEEHMQIWSAIKARFGGNAESTRMRRSLLKHQFEEYKASEEEGLDGGYDKMQKILSKMNTLKIKPDQEDINMKFLRGLLPSWANIAQIMKVKGGLEYMSLDDLYNKLKCLEIDTKGYSVPPSAFANAAFVSSSSSSSSRSKLSYQETNGGRSSAKHSASKGYSSTKSSAIDDVIYSLIADYEEDQHLVFEDLDQVNKEAFDEYEIKHQMAMIAIKARKFEKKYGRPVQFDSREVARFDKKLAKCFK